MRPREEKHLQNLVFVGTESAGRHTGRSNRAGLLANMSRSRSCVGVHVGVGVGRGISRWGGVSRRARLSRRVFLQSQELLGPERLVVDMGRGVNKVLQPGGD